MPSMYNKLFTKILDSSIWLAPDPHRLVWITLLAAMDEDSNAMFASHLNLAARARVTPEEALDAITAFESPDPYSGDPDNEGRRVERIPGGWHVLNGQKYRALVTKAVARERTRERVAKYRAKAASNGDVTTGNGRVTPSEAEAYTETDTKIPAARKAVLSEPEEFKTLVSIYPRRAGANPRGRALRAANARIIEGASWDEMIEGARRYQAYIRATGKEGTEFVRQLSTFVGPDRSYLDPWTIPANKAQSQQDSNVAASMAWLERDNATAG